AGPMLGSSQRLGSGNVLRARGWPGRRAVQGAGVVAAGLVLGALAVVGPYALSGSGEHPTEPARGDGPTANGNDVVQANFAGDGHSGFGAPNRVAASTPAAPVLAVQENRLTARPR